MNDIKFVRRELFMKAPKYRFEGESKSVRPMYFHFGMASGEEIIVSYKFSPFRIEFMLNKFQEVKK